LDSLTVDPLVLPAKRDEIFHALGTPLGDGAEKLTSLGEAQGVVPVTTRKIKVLYMPRRSLFCNEILMELQKYSI
jgi:hypothetical protein